MSPADARRPNLQALTGLRFVAALYVVLYHYARGYLADGPGWAESFNRAGPVAVSLFFILSGLVLTYGSTDAEGRCTKAPRQFWFARFSRIYPLFALAIIPAIPANIAALHHSHGPATSVVFALAQAAFAMLLLQAWIPHLAFGANAPGWSLSVEAFFYLAFPFLVHRFRCRNLRQLLSLTIPLWVLSMTPALIVEITERHGGLQITRTSSVLGTALTPALVAERLAAQFPLARLAEFCIGICIGHFVVARVEQRSGNSTEELAVSMAVRRRLGAMGIASMLALGLALGAAGSLRQTSEIVVNSAFAAPLFAVLVVSLALGVGPHVRLLSSRAFIRLGTASYALYIIQDPFAWWWHRVVHLDLAQPMWLVMFLTAIIATSMACERWIEVPARELLLRHAPAQRRRTDTTLPLARSCDTSAEASVESLSPTIVMHSAWSSKSV